MFHVGYPFPDQHLICTVNVDCNMVAVFAGEVLNGFSQLELLPKMEDRQEELGEALVFHEVGVFHHDKQKIPLHEEVLLESFKVEFFRFHFIYITAKPLHSLGELIISPLCRDKQIIPYGAQVAVEIGKIGKEIGPELAEKDTNNGVEFLHPHLFFSYIEEFLDNDGNEQHLDEHECYVHDGIED